MSDLAARVEKCCGVALETLPLRTRELLAERLDGVDPVQERAIIVGLVSIGETMFCRHGGQLAALSDYLADRTDWAVGRSLRVWSAGCASGEEVYTLSALFQEQGRPAWILGTDVNEAALARARQGVYGPWSLRRVPPEWKARWLTMRGREVVVSPELRRGVSFEVLDLSQSAYPKAQDLVVCRNVLIYLSKEVRARVFERIASALLPDGLLLLAATDPAPGEGWASVPEIFGLYRRVGTESPARPAPRSRRAPSVRARPVPEPEPTPPADACQEETSERVWALAGQGQHGAALEALEAELAERPLAVGLWVQRAIIAEEAGLLKAATDAARRACLLAPSAAAPNVWLGCCLQAVGDTALARNRFKLAERACAGGRDEDLVPYTGGLCVADLRRLIAALEGRPS